MSLIYPEGGARSFDPKRDLTRFVEASVAKIVTETAVFKSVFLEWLMGNGKETFTGDRIAWNVLKTDPSGGASKFFNIFNATSDAVTAQEQNAYLYLQTDPKNAGEKIKLSKIKLQQASGKEAKVDYFAKELRAALVSVLQDLGRSLYIGDPTASNAAEFQGLNYTIDPFTYTSYANQTKSASRALVGQWFDATSTANARASSSGWAVTNGSTTVSKTSHGHTVSAGDVVEITDDRGVVRTFRATASDANSITITPAYDGPTDSSVTVATQSAFKDTTTYGASGKLTLEKIGYVFDQCADGADEPDLQLANRKLFTAIRQEVINTEQSVTMADLSHLGVSMRKRTFLLNEEPLVMDNHAPADTLYFVNTEYVKLKALRGYDGIPGSGDAKTGDRQASRGQLAKGFDLQDLRTASSSFQTLVGEFVFVGDLCSSGLNRLGALTGITS